MDGLSAVASIITVIQIAEDVYKKLSDYVFAVKDAREDIERLKNEVLALLDVLEKVADLKKEVEQDLNLPRRSNLNLLNNLKKPVNECQAELQGLSAKLNTGRGGTAMKRFGRRALQWPFTRKDVDGKIEALERHKGTFNLALTMDNVSLTLATHQGMREFSEQSAATQIQIAATRADIQAHQIDEYRDKITQWLSKTDPSCNHHQACKKHQPHTGEWLIKHVGFENWKMEKGFLLWLYGKPGCGKTVLSSTVIEHMKAYSSSKPKHAVAYFYFDFNDTEKQNAANCVSSLIAQLCSQVADLPEKLKDLYKRCNNGNQKPPIHDLKEMLSLFARSKEFDNVFIIFDAVDECPKNERGELRAEVLELIIEINNQSSSNMHLLITSRPEQDIKEKLMDLPTLGSLSIQGSQVDSDIQRYIGSQLSIDPKLNKLSIDVKATIEKTLMDGADGMFRWVFCQLDELKKCKKKPALLNALKSLPKTLDDTYARILKNIDENDWQEARRALLWLAFSRRPLSIAEVAEAAVVDPQSNPPFDTEDRLLDPCNNILEILGSLVVVSSKRASPDGDSKHDSDLQYYFDDASDNLLSEEIRLAHFSVKEYLVSERIKDGEASKFGVTNIFANHFIAESCLLYIFHYDESESKTASLEDLKRFPLLQYSCKGWYSHANSIAGGTIDSIIFKLFLSDTALSSWLQVYRPDKQYRKPFTNFSAIGTPLYYACHMGLQTVVQLLLDHNAEVDAKAEGGRTALHWAAHNGHEAVVRLLLDHQAEVDAKDEGGWTALYWAAHSGHEAVVRLLLDHQAEVEAKDKGGRTALHWAALNGHEAVVRLLLDHQAEVEAKDKDGWTALHWAAFNGYEAVVRLLGQLNNLQDTPDHPTHHRCIELV